LGWLHFLLLVLVCHGLLIKALDIHTHTWYNRHMKDTEKMGDALEEYTQVQVLEAMADESELGTDDINAWADLWEGK